MLVVVARRIRRCRFSSVQHQRDGERGTLRFQTSTRLRCTISHIMNTATASRESSKLRFGSCSRRASRGRHRLKTYAQASYTDSHENGKLGASVPLVFLACTSHVNRPWQHNGLHFTRHLQSVFCPLQIPTACTRHPAFTSTADRSTCSSSPAITM